MKCQHSTAVCVVSVYVSGSDKRVHLVKIFKTRLLTSFDSYIIGEHVFVGSARISYSIHETISWIPLSTL